MSFAAMLLTDYVRRDSMTSVDNEMEKDKRQTAFHEAGHVIVARHFGLDAHATISRSRTANRESYPYRGQTMYEKTTSFRTAVIAWAGTLAEGMAENTSENWHTPLNESFMVRCADHFISESDSEGIKAHPCKFRTYRTALSILIRKRKQIGWVAQRLIDYRRA